MYNVFFFFFSSRRRHTRLQGDWSSDVCSSDLPRAVDALGGGVAPFACARRWVAVRIRRPQRAVRAWRAEHLGVSHHVAKGQVRVVLDIALQPASLVLDPARNAETAILRADDARRDFRQEQREVGGRTGHPGAADDAELLGTTGDLVDRAPHRGAQHVVDPLVAAVPAALGEGEEVDAGLGHAAGGGAAGSGTKVSATAQTKSLGFCAELFTTTRLR